MYSFRNVFIQFTIVSWSLTNARLNILISLKSTYFPIHIPHFLIILEDFGIQTGLRISGCRTLKNFKSAWLASPGFYSASSSILKISQSIKYYLSRNLIFEEAIKFTVTGLDMAAENQNKKRKLEESSEDEQLLGNSELNQVTNLLLIIQYLWASNILLHF